MLSLVVYLIPYVLGVVLLVALIAAYSNFRQSRTSPYFRFRRRAARQAWRWVLIIVVSLAVLGAAIRARTIVPPPGRISPFSRPPTPLPTLAQEIAPPRTATSGPMPGEATGVPPTITPTQATPLPSPTSLIATIESDVRPPADASLTITAISSGISPQLTPVNPNTTFPAGTQRIYFWLEFTGMVNGASWSQVLLLNGNVVRSESEAWDHDSEGVAYYWFEAQGGWPAGSYEIRFYVGDDLAASEDFSIVD